MEAVIHKIEERALFLTLYYRERISRLAGRLNDQEAHRLVMRKRRKKNTLKFEDLDAKQTAEYLASFILRAEDETRCNDICSSMYFCDRKAGHKGQHSEDVVVPGDEALKWGI
jgi:hypothetical protein